MLDTKTPYKEGDADEGIFLEYRPKETDPFKILKMQKLQVEDSKVYKLTYCELENDSNIKNQLSIDLTFGEIIQL